MSVDFGYQGSFHEQSAKCAVGDDHREPRRERTTARVGCDRILVSGQLLDAWTRRMQLAHHALFVPVASIHVGHAPLAEAGLS